MTDENKREQAQQMYLKICGALENKGWRYDKDDQELTIKFGVRGDDLEMDFRIKIQPEGEFIYLSSVMPYTVAEDKRVEVAMAVCAVNSKLVAGNFDFDLRSGRVIFRIGQSYMGSDISEEALGRLITISTNIIDDYNEKFMGLGVGMVDLDRFLEQLDNE